jgi:ATPase subunit of ABC transporter with duplicated ATPase domains
MPSHHPDHSIPPIRLRAATGATLELTAGWTGVVGASRADERAFLRLAAATPGLRIVDDPGALAPAARTALVAELRAHAGVGLIAARDRALLDELTTATVRLIGDGARLYPGAYSAARAAWQAEGEAGGRERAAAANDRHQARRAEQAHHDALAAEQQRLATRAARGRATRWKGNAAMRGRT